MKGSARRQIWSFYLIGFTDLLGVSMIVPLLPRLMRLRGATPSLAGLIGSLYGALQVFSSPLMGNLSDVCGRRTVLQASYVIPALGYLMLGISLSLPLLAISRIPCGLFKHGLSVSKAYLSDITEVEDRQAVLGLFNACSSLGFIFGPLISGYLADIDDSLQLCMLCGAATFSLNILFIWILVESIPVGENGRKHENTKDDVKVLFNFNSFLPSFNMFKDSKWKKLIDVFIIEFVLSLSSLIFQNNFTIFLQDRFKINYKTLGGITAVKSTATVVAASTCGYVSRMYPNHTKQLIHFTLLLGVCVLVITCATEVWVALVFLIPLAFATSNLRVCVASLLLARAPSDGRGASIGVGNSIISVSRMLSPSFVGVAQEWSVHLSGFVSAGLAGIAALAMVSHPLDGPKPTSNS